MRAQQKTNVQTIYTLLIPSFFSLTTYVSEIESCQPFLPKKENASKGICLYNVLSNIFSLEGISAFEFTTLELVRNLAGVEPNNFSKKREIDKSHDENKHINTKSII